MKTIKNAEKNFFANLLKNPFEFENFADQFNEDYLFRKFKIINSNLEGLRITIVSLKGSLYKEDLKVKMKLFFREEVMIDDL